jgi:hypothetical protein
MAKNNFYMVSDKQNIKWTQKTKNNNPNRGAINNRSIKYLETLKFMRTIYGKF